jgi:hypothetical protein
MGIDDLKDPLAQIVQHKKMAEGQNGGLIWDAITDQFDAGKAAHGGTSISTSSIAGSLSEYHYCER